MSKIKADFIITNIGQLVTMKGPSPRRGRDLENFEIINDAALAAADGKVVAVGKEKDVIKQVELIEESCECDAQGYSVIPGLVDSHTHVAFAGSRSDEFAERLGGVSYEEITARGGGINSTVTPTRKISQDDLLDLSWDRLDSMMLHGTTTCETKSGYALDLDGELKSLRVIKQLKEQHPMSIKSTFLGAHLVPKEYSADPNAYIDLIINEMLPKVAEEKLADYNDVFCETCAFDVRQTEKILKAGLEYGLIPRIHADEMNSLGSVPLGVELGAASVDHLVELTENDLTVLAKSNTVATMMPGTCFFLNLGKYAPGKALIEKNALVAIATDFNPGSAMCESMQIAMALACLRMGFTPAQALAAATIGGAQAIGMADEIGTLEVGKAADLLVLGTKNYVDICYNWGINHVIGVVKGGDIIALDRQLTYADEEHSH